MLENGIHYFGSPHFTHQFNKNHADMQWVPKQMLVKSTFNIDIRSSLEVFNLFAHHFAFFHGLFTYLREHESGVKTIVFTEQFESSFDLQSACSR